MKITIYTVLLLFCINGATAQQLPTDSISGQILYSEIVHVDSITKDELYSMMNEWFAKTYNSATDVIQLNSKEDGKIIGKGVFILTVVHRYNKTETPMTINVPYTISLYIKDNKFKYEVSSFYVSTNMGEFPLESYSTDKAELKEEYKKTIKNENQVEKRVQEQIEFNQGILNETDKQVKNIIMSLKNSTKNKSSNDW